MARTTSEELNQMGAAAGFAANSISMLRETAMSGAKALSSSANELRDRFAKGPAAPGGAPPLRHGSSSGNETTGRNDYGDPASNPGSSTGSSTGSSASTPASDPAKEEKKDKEKDFGGLLKQGTSMLKMAMDLQETQKSFELLTGSAFKAQELMSNLQNMAFKTPFSPTELMKDAEALLQSGTAADDVMKTLILLGDASNGNKEHMEGMVKAFADVQLGGVLTSDALKGMIGAGFNPLEEMSKKTGLSMDDLKTKMEAGQITVGMLSESLALAAGPGGQFFGSMTDQSSTASGRWQEFSERLEAAGTTLASGLLPTVTMFVDNALMPMVGALQWVAGLISEHEELFGILAMAIGGAYLGYQALTMWQNLSATAQALLNAAMNLCPAAWVALAVGAVIGAVLYAWNTFAGFRGAIMGTWEALKGFASLIWDFVVDSIKGVINGISGLGQALMYVFKGDWSKAWETGKQAVKDLVGVDAMKHASDNASKLGSAVSKAYNDEINKKPTSKPALEPPAAPAMAPKAAGWSVAAPGKTPASSSLDLVPPGYGPASTGKQPSALDTLKNATPAKTPAKPTGPASTKMKPATDHTTVSRAPEPSGGGGTVARDKVDGITNGGARSIIINLQKLFDNINISSTTIKEGVSEMEEIVTEALLRVLNSVNALPPQQQV